MAADGIDLSRLSGPTLTLRPLCICTYSWTCFTISVVAFVGLTRFLLRSLNLYGHSYFCKTGLNQIYSMHEMHLPALKPGDGKWYMYLHLYTDQVLITLVATYMHSHAQHWTDGSGRHARCRPAHQERYSKSYPNQLMISLCSNSHTPTEQPSGTMWGSVSLLRTVWHVAVAGNQYYWPLYEWTIGLGNAY